MNERLKQRATAAEKALRWLAYNFGAPQYPDDDTGRMARCIHTYSSAGADVIVDLIDALREHDGHRKEGK